MQREGLALAALTAAKRFRVLPFLVVAVPSQGHARGSVPQNWHQSDMAWGVLLVIFLSGLVGARWARARPGWDAFKGFLVGAFGGFVAVFLSAIAVAILY